MNVYREPALDKILEHFQFSNGFIYNFQFVFFEIK